MHKWDPCYKIRMRENYSDVSEESYVKIITIIIITTITFLKMKDLGISVLYFQENIWNSGLVKVRDE